VRNVLQLPFHTWHDHVLNTVGCRFEFFHEMFLHCRHLV